MPSPKPNNLSNSELKSILENTAIRYLSYRPRFKQEVINRLAKKLVELSISDQLDLIDQIVSSLEKSGFVDDERLLESYIRRHLTGKLRGPYWIRPRLLHFGLNKEQVTTALKKYATKDIQIESIRKFWLKKRFNLNGDQKQKAKFFRALTARGFSLDLILSAFDQNQVAE